MIIVRRGNVRLRVHEQDKQYYKDQGYDILDDKGKVIEKALPKDTGQLTKMYLEARAEVDKYKQQLDDLKKEIKKLKKKD
ncbi:MAG: hypothetical protein J6W84_06215 [Bacteroidales bacterium]|nr:hypothetical protein [Bacteroidales bacterium]